MTTQGRMTELARKRVAQFDEIRGGKNTRKRRHERRCWLVPPIKEGFAKCHAWDEDTVFQSRAFYFPFVEDIEHIWGFILTWNNNQEGGIKIGKSGRVFTAIGDIRPGRDGMDYM